VDSAPASRPTRKFRADDAPTAEGYFANQIGPAIAADIDNSGSEIPYTQSSLLSNPVPTLGRFLNDICSFFETVLRAQRRA
jgi:hypothetical protein